MFKVENGRKRKTGRTDPNWPSKAVRNSSRVPRKDIQANTQTPGGEPMTTAPAFTRDGNCVTADARNNTPAGTATITDWQVQEVVNITIK